MGNCLIGLIYLIITGRINRVICLSTTTKWWPAHYVGMTPKGHILHFNSVLEHKYNPYAPFWYRGRFEGITKDKIPQTLADSGRYVICEVHNLKWFAIFGSILVALFVIPVWFYIWYEPAPKFFKSVYKTFTYSKKKK